MLYADAAPPVLESARLAIHQGMDQLNKAAREIHASVEPNGNLSSPDSVLSLRNSFNFPAEAELQDSSVAQGLSDMVRAVTQIQAGAALVHVYDRMNDTLFHMMDPRNTTRRLDGY